MSKAPIDFLVAVFSSELGAETALKLTRHDQLAGLKETAVIRKDNESKIHIQEAGDAGAGKGAAIGAVVGGLMGLVIGPGAIITSAAGAAIGGLAAKLHDTGFDNQDLKALAEALKPGTSALLAVVEEGTAGSFYDYWKRDGALVVRDAMHPEVSEQLEQEYAGFIKKLQEVGADGLISEESRLSDNIQQARWEADAHTGMDMIKPGT